ncbi:MAG: DEAD/DEAH box helicase [Planctomycetaceae bacterium]|nr:DEAD/DEAH box helicase [Planctomycetaceae bacterium]
MSLFGFHPVIEEWFHHRFDAPTEPQTAGWPHIAEGKHTLIAAPTGSGKTLTAFLACIDRLIKSAPLPEEIRIVYLSPLRALSNDMHRNLEEPLAEIFELANERGVNIPPINVGLRTGDTPSSRRAAIVKHPPHILVTTPESLYLMLTGPKSRQKLKHVETVIVDEIHALIRDKRGSHLSLTLERLDALCGRKLQRIGLSATQKPLDLVAKFLVGEGTQPLPQSIGQKELPADPQARLFATEELFTPLNPPLVRGEAYKVDNANDLSPPFQVGARGGNPSEHCEIINIGHGRELDLAVEVPPSELQAICSHEQWAEIYGRIIELINSHRSTLIFVNTRRMAERVSHQLTELLGEDAVSSHHGSLAADIRHSTEQRLKNGQLKAVVATASLELGLDIGYIDLVIQIGSPRSIATFLQRIGRSGHSLGLTPKGRLFALTRDELVESLALMRAVKDGVLDIIRMPVAPLDILAQQIVAEVSSEEWETDELFTLFRRAFPFRELTREDYDRTLEYLSDGISHNMGRSRVYIYHDRIQGRLRTRKGSRIAATSNGGAIPEIASYRVVAEPEQTVVGTLDEEFAVESMRGDVFLLGNTSWMIQHVRGGNVTVMDAHGAPPSVPFWQGEAPGRTLELSLEVTRLRDDLDRKLNDGTAVAEDWLIEETGASPEAAEQVIHYCNAQKAALGLIPSGKRIVFERFFDETGGMQLVVHAPFGMAITKAWGFSMRKRFCRSFDFELQATADDDGFILSLGPQHSFPIESLFPFLTPDNVQGLLEQAVLTVPAFQVRWRWNVTRALLVHRMNNGKKVPPPLQRFRADDLLTAVFPRLTGCQEEHTGDIELPDHPLVNQTMHDCLTELMDLDNLKQILGQIQRGEIELIARDTREPSPFSYELLNSNPYAFLDGGEAQERRARAVATRRSFDVESVRDLGKLDENAIEQVVEEATPLVRDADELHDLLMGRVILPADEARPWNSFYEQLVEQGRVTSIPIADGRIAWIAAERLTMALAVYPEATPDPEVTLPEQLKTEHTSIEARLAIIRGWIETSGPVTAESLAERIGMTVSQVNATLEALEGEGIVLRGQFTPTDDKERPVEWCHRRLLARIHRLTLDGLRKQISPVGVPTFIRFLARHQGIDPSTKRSSANGLFEIISMLQGLDLSATAWEESVLPLRVKDYDPGWLDELCLTGEIGWGRLSPPKQDADNPTPSRGVTRAAPLTIWLREDLHWLREFVNVPESETLSETARSVLEFIQTRGATFATDMLHELDLLPAPLEDAISELVTRSWLTADGFAGLRQLIADRSDIPNTFSKKPPKLVRARRTVAGAGRWSVIPRPQILLDRDTHRDYVEQWAWQLLRRWGIIFKDLLQRESATPSWFDLLQVYRKLEARGEIRGGRFVSGVAGEQFALPDAVRKLRKLRDEGPNRELLVVTGADPVNLVGILTEHPRVPSIATNKVAYVDGVPLAALQGGDVIFFTDLGERMQSHLADILKHGRRLQSAVMNDSPAAQAARD